MRVAANLATMFTDVPLLNRYEKAARIGFKLVEVPFPYSVPASDLKREADKNNLSHVLINAPVGNFDEGDRGIAAIPGKSKEFKESINVALEYAKLLNCPKIHIMAGFLKSDKKMAEETFVENLAFANDIFEKEGIQLLIEPINSYSMPGYFLNSVDQAISVIEKIGSDNVKLLFDVFHVQQIHGQITGLTKKFKNKIGHIQVAQIPDRHEPDSPGELDYSYVFEVLKSANGNWTIGCEYFDLGTVEWVTKYGLIF